MLLYGFTRLHTFARMPTFKRSRRKKVEIIEVPSQSRKPTNPIVTSKISPQIFAARVTIPLKSRTRA